MLARWLNAKFYISKYRPVPIEEHLVFDNAIYPAATSRAFYDTAASLSDVSQSRVEPCGVIDPSPTKELTNTLLNAVVALANETARSGYGALVFCSSRGGCERDAELISRVLPDLSEIAPETLEKREELLQSLRSTSTGLDPVLGRIILFGVAFHRACMSPW